MGVLGASLSSNVVGQTSCRREAVFLEREGEGKVKKYVTASRSY